MPARIDYGVGHVNQVVCDFDVYNSVANVWLDVDRHYAWTVGHTWRFDCVVDYLNVARIDDGDILRRDSSEKVLGDDYVVSIVTRARAAARLNANRAGCFQPIVCYAAIVAVRERQQSAMPNQNLTARL